MYREPPPEEPIKAALCGQRAKWGWVVYRTSFDDNDEPWQRLKKLVLDGLQKQIETSNHPEIAQNLDLKFIEDKKLDAVTTEQLRQHFLAWVARVGDPTSADAENLDVSLGLREGLPRYIIFIQAGKEEFQSLADGISSVDMSESFVRVVDAKWKADPEELGGYDSVEGCTEDNVGWFRSNWEHLTMLDYYTLFYHDVTYTWYPYYVRPPEVLRIFWDLLLPRDGNQC